MLIAIEQNTMDGYKSALIAATNRIEHLSERLATEIKRATYNELLTSEQAAKYLGVSPQNLNYYRNQGLPYYKPCGQGVWFRRGEIDEWINSGRINKHKH